MSDVRAIIVSIQDTINNQDVLLSQSETEKINQIINTYKDKSVSAAL